ncbi:MAG TPA: hypothetical protein VFU22_12360, partial [Roseiflexaceae bacterium]|nr:hypothetical protein [Roseiflexaceae bacterium]
MSNFLSRSSGWLAIAIGATTLVAVGSLVLFFIIGGAFGALNDVCNAVEALLSAALAWRLFPWLRSHA